jgi:F-type H+/Na+-transporting ATPase subunit alpha
VLDKGARNVEILKQAQYSPVEVSKQVAIIHLGTTGALRSIPVNKIRAFEEEYFQVLSTKHADVLKALGDGKIDDDLKATLDRVGAEVAKSYA